MATGNTATSDVAENATRPAGNHPTVTSRQNGISVTLSDFLGIAYIVIGLLGIVGNGLSCLVILSHKPLRRRLANYFLINQCFMDLIISLLMLVNTAANLDSLQFANLAGLLSCYLWKSRLFVVGLLVSSTLSIVAVSVERYVEVVHPIRHRLVISQRIVYIILVMTWVVGVLFKMSTLLPFARFSNGVCSLGNFPSTAVSTFIVVYNSIGEFFGPICVISFCYVKMWAALQSKSIVGPMPSSNQPSKSSKALRARRNIFKTLLTVVLTFVATWSFKQFLALANGLGIVQVDWNGVPYKVSVIFQFSSCCLNPFIYLFQYEEFQRGLLRCVRPRKIHARAEHQSNVTSI